MTDHLKRDARVIDTAKALKDDVEKRPKPKHQRAVCSVCGAGDVALYRHTAPVALYCAKHVPPR